MLKSKSMLLCLLSMVIGSYCSLVPFIDKCVWNDKPCLLKSSQKAISFFAAGLPALDASPLDPLAIDQVTMEEGGLKVVFKSMTVLGAAKCEVRNLERNIEEESLLLEAECPIEMNGFYTASGKLLFAPIEGDGPFHVKTNKIFFQVKVPLKEVDGSDGQKYWKIGKEEFSYKVKEKAYLNFENLFNGDKEKADPILAILDQSWEEMMESVGKPLVTEIMKRIIESIRKVTAKVPVSDLEQKP